MGKSYTRGKERVEQRGKPQRKDDADWLPPHLLSPQHTGEGPYPWRPPV